MVILDTLNRAAPNTDENDSKDMNAIIDAAKALQEALGGLVVLIHHSGKDATKGLRGHSSLGAALDAAIEVTRDGDRREWTVYKAKDGAEGIPRPFTLEVSEIGTDDDGEAITSCVVRQDIDASEGRRQLALPKSGNQRIVWDALGEPLRESVTYGMVGAPPGRPRITMEAAIDQVRGKLPVEPVSDELNADGKPSRDWCLEACYAIRTDGYGKPEFVPVPCPVPATYRCGGTGGKSRRSRFGKFREWREVLSQHGDMKG